MSGSKVSTTDLIKAYKVIDNFHSELWVIDGVTLLAEEHLENALQHLDEVVELIKHSDTII